MRFCLFICMACWTTLMLKAQQPDIYFHSLGVPQGLNDGVINDMVQDKEGYVWLASLSAINRFNGTQVKRYTPVFGDSTSAPNEVPWVIYADPQDRIWITYDFGLYQLDKRTDKFIRHRAFDGDYASFFTEGPDGEYWMLTRQKGLTRYDPQTRKRYELQKILPGLEGVRITAMHRRQNTIWLATTKGLYQVDARSRRITFTAFKNGALSGVRNLYIDAANTTWAVDAEYKIHRFRLPALEPLPVSAELANPGQTTVNFTEPDDQNLYIGILLDGVYRLHQPAQRLEKVVGRNNRGDMVDLKTTRDILSTREGTIFTGVVDGALYFHPNKNLFSFIEVAPPGRALRIGRCMIEDQRGNLWFTTSDGISLYNRTTKSYRVWHNVAGQRDQVHYNSIRGVAEGADGTIWIATGKGINSYTYGDSELKFYDSKDSIPQGFYFSAGTDSKGRTWFGCRDFDGLYYYSIHDKKFHGIAGHPLLSKYKGMGFRAFFEDSKGRLWFGGNQSGLVMMDEQKGITRHWFNDNKNRNTISGNLVVDIVEDKQGIIWVSTFNGVTGIDLQKETYNWLNNKNLLSNNNTGPLYVDNKNRLWIGAANGLYVVDAERKSANLFDQQAGLLSANFTEFSSLRLRDGTVMMPTTNGIACFDPEQYDPEPLQYGFSIKNIAVLSGKDRLAKPVSEILKLAHDENVVEFELEAINYVNPSQTWYAFALLTNKGDTAWQYTQNPRVIATLQPGGPYTILFKASANQSDWEVPVKRVTISLSIPIPQQLWFPFVLAAIAFAGFWILYRYRIRHVQRMQALESKTQLLQKEKAMVMYENLKQHLNPHFLFNSLTSLSSLIRLDQNLATDFLDRMSRIYRYILKNRESETVILKDELQFVQLFIDLQKTRFEEGLQVNIGVDEEQQLRRIAPVTLQNLLENAIKHNTISKNKPLVIDIVADEDYLVVRNNLQQKNFVETSNKTGLQSLKSLYHYLSNKPVTIEKTETHFTVSIPLI